MQHSESDPVEEGNLGLWEYFTSNYDTQDFLDDGDEWNSTSNPDPFSTPATSTLTSSGSLGDNSSARHGHQGSTTVQAGGASVVQPIPQPLHFNPQANGYGQLTVQIAHDHNGNALILPGQSAFYRPHESDETVSIAIQPNMLQLQQPATTNMASMNVSHQQQQQQLQHYPHDKRCSIHGELIHDQSSLTSSLYACAFNAQVVRVGAMEHGSSMTSGSGHPTPSLSQQQQCSTMVPDEFLHEGQASATDWTRHNTNRQVETDDGATGKPASFSASMKSSESAPEHGSLESCVNNGHFASCDDSKPPATCPTMSPMSLLPHAHDKRCKPLTGYNYFYRDERDNIVGNLQQRGDPLPDPVRDFSAEKMEQLLHHHWYVDSLKGKRKHKKVHGKIDFPELSKVIAERWKLLPEAGRAFYRKVASVDHAEYERYLKRLHAARQPPSPSQR